MTRLEERYRRLLRVLPAWYRDEREREMVDVFLESRAEGPHADLDREYGWPGWGETAAVAALAVRTRVGGDGAPAGPRGVGDTVRAAAAIGVLLGAGGAATGVLWQIVATVAGPPEARVVTEALLHPTGAGGWWNTLALVLGLCWLPAWTALSAGRSRATLLLALVACTPSVIELARSVIEGYGALWHLATSLTGPATVALLLLGHHRDAAPPVIARPWALLATSTVVLAAVSPLVLVLRQVFAPAAGALLLAAVAVVLVRPRGAVAAGVAVTAGIATLGGLLELAAVDAGGGAVITTGLGAAATLVAAAAARRSAAGGLARS